ncbi:MAG: hypothetical protein R3321_01425 [Nitrososphaeraceae archaeon]|nr:hypothetical protein [Nitrososphaeraceae archaeon]
MIDQLEEHLNRIWLYKQAWGKLRLNRMDDIVQLVKLGVAASASGQSIGSKIESYLKTINSWSTPKGKNTGDALTTKGKHIEIKFSSKFIGGKQLLRKDSKVDYYLLVSCLIDDGFKLYLFLLTPDELYNELRELNSSLSYSSDVWGYDIRFMPSDVEPLNRWLDKYKIGVNELNEI